MTILIKTWDDATQASIERPLEPEFEGAAGREDPIPLRRSEPYWYEKDEVKRPVEVTIKFRASNSLVDTIQTLFRSHEWLFVDDDDDGKADYDLLITEISCEYPPSYESGDWIMTLKGYTRPPSDLALWLKLDYGEGSIAFDSSKGKNHGDISGAIWTTGKRSRALSFQQDDVYDDYVEIDYNTTLDPAKRTYIAWVKIPAQASSGIYNHILINKHANYREGLYTQVAEAAGPVERFYFSLYIGGSAYGVTYTHAFDDMWHLIVGTYDGETLKLYFDRALVGSNGAPSGDIDDNAEPVRLMGGTANRYTKGLMGEAMILSRDLTQAEITDLYNRWA